MTKAIPHENTALIDGCERAAMSGDSGNHCHTPLVLFSFRRRLAFMVLEHGDDQPEVKKTTSDRV